jgi:hypothetical protein
VMRRIGRWWVRSFCRWVVIGFDFYPRLYRGKRADAVNCGSGCGQDARAPLGFGLYWSEGGYFVESGGVK